jgi:hypothetical protein
MYDDFLARILEPDVFLPAQFYGTSGLSRQLEGEKRLMIAILKDAVECLDKFEVRNSVVEATMRMRRMGPGRGKWLFPFTNIQISWDLILVSPWCYCRKSVRQAGPQQVLFFPRLKSAE